MVTSHADRTSPVLRGKWILENIARHAAAAAARRRAAARGGDEAAQAAVDARADGAASREPGVRELPQRDGPARLRARELRRRRRVADARRRTRGDADRRVGSAGRRHDRSTAWSSCAQALLREPEMFVRTLTEKLLTYALGRGLTATDMPAVRAIVRDVGARATTGSRRSCSASSAACRFRCGSRRRLANGAIGSSER